MPLRIATWNVNSIRLRRKSIRRFVRLHAPRILSVKLCSWWSYRAPDWKRLDKGRRLDHIWVTPDLAVHLGDFAVIRASRGWKLASDHAPVMVTLTLPGRGALS